MSEYVTEEDLGFPDCDCGHWLGKHSIVPHRHTARLIECDCRKTSVDLTLDHWDQVVRREVAKELRAFAAKLRQDVDATGPPRTHADITCATAILSDAAEAEKRATAVESGGQS